VNRRTMRTNAGTPILLHHRRIYRVGVKTTPSGDRSVTPTGPRPPLPSLRSARLVSSGPRPVGSGALGSLDKRIYSAYTCNVPGFPDNLAQCTGFQWDGGNADKNWALHQVSQSACEQVFFNRPVLVAPDVEHSEREARFAALGRTNAGRRLTIVFTVRGTLVRIISARDMSRRERRMYEQG
jgi:uncharacterized protein